VFAAQHGYDAHANHYFSASTHILIVALLIFLKSIHDNTDLDGGDTIVFLVLFLHTLHVLRKWFQEQTHSAENCSHRSRIT
jgi:hypothetical protein